MFCSIYASALLSAGSSIKTLIKSAEIEPQEGKPIEENQPFDSMLVHHALIHWDGASDRRGPHRRGDSIQR